MLSQSGSLKSELLVVAGMYIHGRCNYISRTSWYKLGRDVHSAAAHTIEQLYACSLFKLSQALGTVCTVAGKLLKTVEARIMGEFMKTTVFVVGRTKCSGCRTDRVYSFSGRISLIKWFGTFFTERR